MSQSRYDATETRQHLATDGRVIVHLARRLLPQPEELALLRTHVVTEGFARLDLVAAHELGDPELFWQVCDANRAMRAEDLEVVGEVLRITLPHGVPAPRND